MPLSAQVNIGGVLQLLQQLPLCTDAWPAGQVSCEECGKSGVQGAENTGCGRLQCSSKMKQTLAFAELMLKNRQIARKDRKSLGDFMTFRSK
jgi:hypothetical protein